MFSQEVRSGPVPDAAFRQSQNRRTRNGGCAIDVVSRAISLSEQGEEFCLAIVVGKSGSAPQVPGAKSLFLRDGRIFGTIGGGCLEMEARRLALEAMQQKKPLCKQFKLDDDFGWDDGLICGGRVEVLLLPNPTDYVAALTEAVSPGVCGELVFDTRAGTCVFRKGVDARREVFSDGVYIEPVRPSERLIVFGAGHLGREVARQASLLGFHVTVVDDREDMVTDERLPWAHEKVVANLDEYAEALQTDEDTFICVVTRGHRNDARVLKGLIKKQRAYLGMIGSKRKREVVKKEMLANGICNEEEFQAVESPMGIDIGAETVAEIAISIAARLVAVRSERRGPVTARCSPQLVSRHKAAE